MKIKAETSYNLDLLCFMNVLTGRKLFMEHHKESYDKFYPIISNQTKERLDRVSRLGFPQIGTYIAVPLSSMADFNSRNLIEILADKPGLKNSMKGKIHPSFTGLTSLVIPVLIDRITIPLAKELENAGFKEFWQTSRLPLIQEKSHEIDEYMKKYDPVELVNQYINFGGSDFNIYLCSFAKPLGIKLCGNNMVADCTHKNDSILEILTHEVFHPPYDIKKVKNAVKTLGKKPWVKTAYKNQNPDTTYRPMRGFVEENIVEALGTYVAIQLGLDFDPKEYFKEHDDGSHVISPYFYDYLCENKKEAAVSFEDYFIKFVDGLSV